MKGRGAVDINLDGLRRSVRGRVIAPFEDGWDQVRQPWNRRVDQRPAAVVDLVESADVVTTVRYATDHGLRVSTQAVGHQAGVPLEESLLIRTSRWRELTVSPERRRATVGPGARWGDLLAATDPMGLTGLTGTSNGVSVTGYSLHGGAGPLGRRFGFAANDVVGAEVVTADGQVVRTDATSHPELFWALRGGGGGFGIVVSLEVRLHPAPQLYGGQLLWAAEHARTVLAAWSQWAGDVPPEPSSMAAVVTLPPFPAVPQELRGRTVVGVTLCHLGDRQEAERLVAPLREAAPVMADALRPLRIGDLGFLRFEPPEPVPVRMRADLLSDLPGAAVDAIVDAIGLGGGPGDAPGGRPGSGPGGPGSGSPLTVVEVRHLGGAFASFDPGHGALGPVEAPFMIEAVGFAATPDQDAAVVAGQGALTRALEQWRTGTTLPSFADPTRDSGRVFSPATRDRLRDVKGHYDPAGTLVPTFSFLEPYSARHE